jgi:hypothetical protein
MLLKRKRNNPRDFITNVSNPYSDQWRESDVTFCEPSTEDMCGHGSSVPNGIKPKIMA